MAVTLNFSQEEKEKVKRFLQRFEKAESKSHFEEFRCKIGGCSVTLYNTGKVLIQGGNEENAKELILQNVKAKSELILGIDETGRGESFGPFVIAAVLGKVDDLRELRDSKKVKNLDEKYALVKGNAKKIVVYSVTAKEIDELRAAGKTMNRIENNLIKKIAKKFQENHPKLRVLVDGKELLGKIPGVEFIPGGDDKNAVIGAASIVAKHTREKSGDKTERKSWKNSTA